MSWTLAQPPLYTAGPKCPVDGLSLSVRQSPRRGSVYGVVSLGAELIEALDWGDLAAVGLAWGGAENRGQVRLEPVVEGAGLKLRRPSKMARTWGLSVSDLPADFGGVRYKHQLLKFEQLTHAKVGHRYLVAQLPVNFYRRIEAAG